jgi:hypothetical protein
MPGDTNQEEGKRKRLDQQHDQIAYTKKVMIMEIKFLISPVVKT